jgi:hypothetical protein
MRFRIDPFNFSRQRCGTLRLIFLLTAVYCLSMLHFVFGVLFFVLIV